MNSSGVKSLIDEFLRFIEEGSEEDQESITRLSQFLDSLVFAYYSVDFTFDKADYPEYSGVEYKVVRELVEMRFPELGYYNFPEGLRAKIMETPMMVGDAVDDLVDIVLELKEVKWRWENTSRDDALWYYKQQFEFHWEEHARNLSVFLRDLRMS